jgi:two-component system, NarL family, nitrate/nitrite response regulator NarL
MGDGTSTVIIESRSLIRAALVSLIESHSYHVVGSIASMTDIDCGALKEVQPKLVILGMMPADRVAEAASSIRRRWQDAKIIMLFEKASSTNLQNLLASGLDGCIPMFASADTLIGALQLIVGKHARLLMVSDSASPGSSVCLAGNNEDGSKLEGRPRIASFMPALDVSASEMSGPRKVLAQGPLDGPTRGCGLHGLSQREDQVLKALVQGHSNKVIARMYTVTEATVKVHVKSILRKTRVANRTQAAIWALKNTYFGEDMNEKT